MAVPTAMAGGGPAKPLSSGRFAGPARMPDTGCAAGLAETRLTRPEDDTFAHTWRRDSAEALETGATAVPTRPYSGTSARMN
jgi:hypothetical protein